MAVDQSLRLVVPRNLLGETLISGLPARCPLGVKWDAEGEKYLMIPNGCTHVCALGEVSGHLAGHHGVSVGSEDDEDGDEYVDIERADRCAVEGSDILRCLNHAAGCSFGSRDERAVAAHAESCPFADPSSSSSSGRRDVMVVMGRLEEAQRKIQFYERWIARIKAKVEESRPVQAAILKYYNRYGRKRQVSSIEMVTMNNRDPHQNEEEAALLNIDDEEDGFVLT
jgi:hypothetical protein